ncbi:MAG: TIGR03915 family putative DNA repair protein [Gracilibacteraceae bacterium]|jgi:probable DNA metabolism protein|nr:TIGR03915 family putative DNA repair protein [Gracilibacteraceae bacterium]
MDYLYDGSFDGLLTTVYHDYYSGRAEGIHCRDTAYQGSLFSENGKAFSEALTPENVTTVDTDLNLADRVYRAIEDKLATAALPTVYRTFLSNAADKETLILRYLRFSFSVGPKADAWHTHPHVQPVQKIAAQVGMEMHGMLGLLRFTDTKKFLYAPLAPKHNILPLIAEHFSDRLREENFMIHDTRRHLAVVHEAGESWCLQTLDDQMAERLEFEASEASAATQEEIWYQQLWRRYFETVAIESRRNKRLQSRFIPQRYRRYLIEFTT